MTQFRARDKRNGITNPPMYEVLYMHLTKSIMNMTFSLFLVYTNSDEMQNRK